MVDKDLYVRWQAALELTKAQQKRGGIGTLSEKPIHAAIKYTIEPNDSYHEVRIGSSVADVITSEGIWEVQTRNLHSMKKKLEFFLTQGLVTVVHPIAAKKTIFWVDEDSGEVSKPGVSPKKGKPLDSFMELIYLRDYLLHPNFRLQLWMLEMEEYRFLNGYGESRKKRATRYQQIPVDLKEIVACSCGEDYRKLLPELPERFTRKDLKAAAKRSDCWTQRCIYTLEQLGLAERIGKQGNSIVYQMKK